MLLVSNEREKLKNLNHKTIVQNWNEIMQGFPLSPPPPKKKKKKKKLLGLITLSMNVFDYFTKTFNIMTNQFRDLEAI